MLTRALISTLRCPTCREGELRTPQVGTGRLEHGGLVCSACGAVYPMQRGVPVLMPEPGGTAAEGRAWSERVEAFQTEPEARLSRPYEPTSRLSRSRAPHASFARFAGISKGRVLDVGCGTGAFREELDLAGVEYVGLDPVALPQATDFPFVQGLAERIPFHDGTFTDVVVLSALDHFRDPDTFFEEARRVLGPGGRLHIVQNVRQARGPLSAIKMAGSRIKDALEERGLAASPAPQLVSEFTIRSLLQRACPTFDVRAIDEYAATWYDTKLFLSFTPNAEVFGRTAWSGGGAGPLPPSRSVLARSSG